MKKVLIITALALTLLFAGCVVKDFPDISGLWAVNAAIEGNFVEFDMLVVPNAYTFHATATAGVTVLNGRLSKAGDINFLLVVDESEYAFYGAVEADYMSGFLRKGVAGEVVGNWSANKQ
jgi:hypothetical protein